MVRCENLKKLKKAFKLLDARQKESRAIESLCLLDKEITVVWRADSVTYKTAFDLVSAAVEDDFVLEPQKAANELTNHNAVSSSSDTLGDQKPHPLTDTVTCSMRAMQLAALTKTGA